MTTNTTRQPAHLPTTRSELAHLTTLALEAAGARETLRDAVLAAHASGRFSLRELADATGMSHMTIARLAVKG